MSSHMSELVSKSYHNLVEREAPSIDWNSPSWVRKIVQYFLNRLSGSPTATRCKPDPFLPEGAQIKVKDPWLHVYRSWVNCWLACSKTGLETTKSALTLKEQAECFRAKNLPHLLDYNNMMSLVLSFRQSLEKGDILFGGTHPPSCSETNMASASYNPRTDCSCSGLFPIPADITLDNILQKTDCGAIQQTLRSFHTVIERQTEWAHSSLYTAESLQRAVSELLLANADIDQISPPTTCAGSKEMPSVLAPDRRPHVDYDAQPAIRYQIYPKAEQVKLCVDAKQYLVIASNTSASDRGIVAAIADAGNDILIGDYCEVADDETLWLLQQTGAAAVAFVKLCHLAGMLSDWHFNNMMASTLHFRVLGYYRNHAEIPGGIYGSRMTGILVHRYIDLSLFHAVLTASLATGERLSDSAYFRLNEVCTLVNDMVDFRSDTARKQRENVVLRGVRGDICRYLDGLICRCLEIATDAVRSSPVSARVLMSFCNWAVLGSHHKLYELNKELTLRANDYNSSPCQYRCVTDSSQYANLLEALHPYGTLGDRGPSVSKTRVHMDLMYSTYSESEPLHLAWLADMTRSLLEPNTLRRILDVVHFEWSGNVGDVNYCP